MLTNFYSESSGDQDSAVQEVHDGMATFKGWGPRVRTFAMAFDADQGKLYLFNLSALYTGSPMLLISSQSNSADHQKRANSKKSPPSGDSMSGPILSTTDTHPLKILRRRPTNIAA